MPKHGNLPWRKPEYNYAPGIIGLHEEINHFYDYILPTPCEHAARIELVKRIEDMVRSLWPAAVLEIFGSFRIGLLLPNADIDVVIIGRWARLPLYTIKLELIARGIAEDSNILVLNMAVVPIIKFKDRETNIKVDISFNMENGILSAEMVKNFKRDFPGLGKLVMVLKQFLAQRELNEVFSGGISSYSLVLMCISFLQLHPRNVLHDESNLGVLLLEFFKLYGLSFNYAKLGISIRQGGSYIQLHDVPFGHKPWPLCIEDPLQPENNIGRGTYGVVAVKQAFQWAYLKLNEAITSSDQNESLLGNIIQISDKLLCYRSWLHEKFNHLVVVEPSTRTLSITEATPGPRQQRAQPSQQVGQPGVRTKRQWRRRRRSSRKDNNNERGNEASQAVST